MVPAPRPATQRVAPADRDAVERGAYLVEGLTHCGACHTPRNAFGAEDNDRFMAGGAYLDKVGEGAYRPWSAPDVTSSTSTHSQLGEQEAPTWRRPAWLPSISTQSTTSI